MRQVTHDFLQILIHIFSGFFKEIDYPILKFCNPLLKLEVKIKFVKEIQTQAW